MARIYCIYHYLQCLSGSRACGELTDTSSKSTGQVGSEEESRGRTGDRGSSLGEVEVEEVTEESREGRAPKDLTEAQEDSLGDIGGPKSGVKGGEDTGALRITLIPDLSRRFSSLSVSAALGIKLTMHFKGKHKLEASSTVDGIQLRTTE